MIIDLVIAGNTIRLHSEDHIFLKPDVRFGSFITSAATDPCLYVEVRSGRGSIPEGSEKVFDAGLIEEAKEGKVMTGEPFWEVRASDDCVFVQAWLKNPERQLLLAMPKGTTEWQIFTDEAGPVINPLPYPIDGLLLYFLGISKGDIMIHGSGVSTGGRGWIFSGASGSGKTTIAAIFDRNGDRVIHDDRLILRKEDGRWIMHSTPVYRNDEPRHALVDHLWIISHGRSNIASPVTGAEAAALVLSNCVQQNWDSEAADHLLASVEDLVSSVRVSCLAFIPDDSVRDYLLVRQSKAMDSSAQAATSLLDEGKELIITAGGYSMWPAIKPGDRIVIKPFNTEIPLAAGMVVALRREGGFVVHRVAEFRRGKLSNFIRTRGDASIITDPWTTVRSVAGLVEKISPDGRRSMVSPRQMPAFMAAMAVMVIRITRGLARRNEAK